MKNLIFYAQIVLIVSVLFYWYNTSTFLNPIAIILLLILLSQMYFKNIVIGMIVPAIIILASLYMILALISEINDFSRFDNEAKNLSLIVAIWTSITLVTSVFLMIVNANRYGKSTKHVTV